MKEAVIDRIVDGKRCVLLVGEEETEYIVPASGVLETLKEGDWVNVRFNENGAIVDIQPNPAKGQERRQAIQAKMAKLRAKKGSQFKS